jgi:hypothetical protein
MHTYPAAQGTSGDNKKDPYEYLKTSVSIGSLVISILALAASIYSARASNKSASAAQENVATSRAALQATIDSNRLDQRAWVGIVQRVEQVIEVGSPVKVSIRLRNSGKTPALNVSPLIMPASLLSKQKFPTSPPYISGTNPRGKFVIQPGPGAEVRVEVEGTKLSQGDIDELKNGTRTGYVYGKISYDDIFYKPHCATFCLRIDSNLTGVSFCDTYNNETDGYCE